MLARSGVHVVQAVKDGIAIAFTLNANKIQNVQSVLAQD